MGGVNSSTWDSDGGGDQKGSHSSCGLPCQKPKVGVIKGTGRTGPCKNVGIRGGCCAREPTAQPNISPSVTNRGRKADHMVGDLGRRSAKDGGGNRGQNSLTRCQGVHDSSEEKVAGKGSKTLTKEQGQTAAKDPGRGKNTKGDMRNTDRRRHRKTVWIPSHCTSRFQRETGSLTAWRRRGKQWK